MKIKIKHKTKVMGMRIYVHIQNALIVSLFLVLLGFTPDVLKAVQVQTTAQIQRVTLSELQQKFYKAELEVEIRVMLDEVSMNEALSHIAKEAGLKLTYRGDILTERSITLQQEAMSVSEALENVLEGTGLDYQVSKDGYLLINQAVEINKDEIFQDPISGQVIDALTGEAIPGVNILIEGTSTGTSTDVEGRYELVVPNQGTLIFSYIGYQTIEVSINDQTVVNIELEPIALGGSELVVIGYGTQQQRQITGSVSSVQSNEFVTGNINNVSELIQGKVPGLTIAQPGGNPNSSPTIRLRGISTFSANQSPLIVVDGIIGASLENLDPNDVESIDVLKDASASAIYGTRGAAGVIVVTTKRGETGDFSINYNGNFSIVGIENRLDVLSAEEFRRFSQETGFSINDQGHDTDWFKEITQNGTNNSHSLALSGGNESTNYRISGNFRQANGIQKGTGFQQLNGRLNLNQKALNDNLNFTFNLGITNREEDLGFDAAFRYGAIFNPTFPVRADGFESTGGFYTTSAFDMHNPVGILETGENKRMIERYNGSIRAEYDFSDLIPGITTSIFYSIESTGLRNNIFHSKNSQFGGGANPLSLGRGSALRSVINDQSELFEFVFNYLKTGIFRFEIVSGYSFSDQNSEGTSVSGGDFVSDAAGFYNLAFAQDFSQGRGSVSSFNNTNRIIGFFGRANLSWDDTYFFNTSIRREGSSRFGDDHKWGTFGSIGAGMELTNIIDIPFMSQLKVRSSFGITGQDAPFSGISQIRYGPSQYFFADGAYIQKFAPVSNSNPDLKWEENHEFNVGVDLQMWNYRLNISTDYYIRNTKDLLFNVDVPVPPNLYSTSWRNIGQLENKGLDISLRADLIQNPNLNWNTGFIFSTFSTLLKKYINPDQAVLTANAGAPGQNNTDMVRVRQGEPIGQFWGPQFAGISSEGEWLFFSHGGEEVTFDQVTSDDHRIIGSGLPDFSLGWTNNIDYRNWNISGFVRGVFDHDIINTFRLFYEAPSQITTYNVLNSSKDISNLRSSPLFSSYHVEDGSFIRLQNLSIGYRIPLSDDSSIRNLSLSISGNNLFTITGYKGIDPEINFIDSGSGGSLAPGIERRNSWFNTRSFTFGINIQI